METFVGFSLQHVQPLGSPWPRLLTLQQQLDVVHTPRQDTHLIIGYAAELHSLAAHKEGVEVRAHRADLLFLIGHEEGSWIAGIFRVLLPEHCSWLLAVAQCLEIHVHVGGFGRPAGVPPLPSSYVLPVDENFPQEPHRHIRSKGSCNVVEQVNRGVLHSELHVLKGCLMLHVIEQTLSTVMLGQLGGGVSNQSFDLCQACPELCNGFVSVGSLVEENSATSPDWHCAYT
mmetsp:Transcript_75856/g.180199  ORF Transcript_75856/g.180199 Transcript_75856/m.180199 type:complete len:230 (-) Transcript_75856:1025-1714(-)